MLLSVSLKRNLATPTCEAWRAGTTSSVSVPPAPHPELTQLIILNQHHLRPTFHHQPNRKDAISQVSSQEGWRTPGPVASLDIPPPDSLLRHLEVLGQLCFWKHQDTMGLNVEPFLKLKPTYVMACICPAHFTGTAWCQMPGPPPARSVMLSFPKPFAKSNSLSSWPLLEKHGKFMNEDQAVMNGICFPGAISVAFNDENPLHS
ncbi:hypothetical protein P7K49_014302 [Saguinus oedipus]|uniref:Uncharacterized protein n=1 Tax=Saguinus oedipus TaxID=9490 RepID=A0ABQ9VIS8_SAGOE|nr:hypothetical protein P7K49_014302 [Saguinus oedipus]